MTDRELLEAAAKAGGKIIIGWNSQHGGAEVAVLADGSFWQPLHENHLTDCMGDALRLAVALRLEVSWWRSAILVETDDKKASSGICAFTGDPAAATRRAITRAAAASINVAVGTL